MHNTSTMVNAEKNEAQKVYSGTLDMLLHDINGMGAILTREQEVVLGHCIQASTKMRSIICKWCVDHANKKELIPKAKLVRNMPFLRTKIITSNKKDHCPDLRSAKEAENELLSIFRHSLQHVPDINALVKHDIARILKKYDIYPSRRNRRKRKNSEPYLEATRVIEEGEAARKTLVERNIPLAINRARRLHRGHFLGIDDLTNEGILGLIRAGEGFDPSMGTRFATYATWWVNQTIKMALKNKSQTIRVPPCLQETLWKWTVVAAKIEGETGYPAAFDDVADAMKLSRDERKRIRDGLAIFGHSISTGKHSDDDTRSATAILSSKEIPPPKIVEKSELIQIILNIIDSVLDDREIAILKMRYGLGHVEPQTLEQVGDVFSVSKERIRQIEKNAIRKLQMNLEDRYSTVFKTLFAA